MITFILWPQENLSQLGGVVEQGKVVGILANALFGRFDLAPIMCMKQNVRYQN
jgi:hypothetical protein